MTRNTRLSLLLLGCFLAAPLPVFCQGVGSVGTSGGTVGPTGPTGPAGSGVTAPYTLSGVGDTVPLTVNAITGQTAKLQSWGVNGVQMAYVDAAGDIVAAGGLVAVGNVTATTGVSTDLVGSRTAATLGLVSAAANGSSATAALINTTNALTTPGAKIFSFYNNSVEKAYIDKDGRISTGTLHLDPGIIISGFDSIWLRQATPASTNYTLATNGGALYVNSADANAGTINFLFGGVVKANIDHSGYITSASSPVGRSVAVPGTSSAACTPGDFAADTSYFYICVSSASWRRVAIASW